MEAGENTLSGSASSAIIHQPIKEELQEEVVTNIDTNTNEISNVSKDINVNTPLLNTDIYNAVNDRQSIDQLMPNLNVLNNEMVTVKTEPSLDQTQNEEKKIIRSTSTTPERPSQQIKTITFDSRKDNTVPNTLKEATLGSDVPEGFFDDLLRTADQISEQMSPPAVKEEINDLKEQDQEKSQSGLSALHESIRTADTEPEAIPENFFDDLLEERAVSRINVKSEYNPNVVIDKAAAEPEVETIPENFFDDLLKDRVAARIERLQNEEEEVKYADQIKNIQEQLRELDEEMESKSPNKHKKHKHKKSKKKSHKRSRENADDVEKSKTRHEVVICSNEDDNNEELRHKRRKRTHSPIEIRIDNNESYGNLQKVVKTSGISSNDLIFQNAAPYILTMEPPEELAGSSKAFSTYPLPFIMKPETNVFCDENTDKLDCLPVQQPKINNDFNAFSGFKKIKLEIRPTNQHQIKREDNIPLTPATKRQKALENAAKTIKELKSAKNNLNSSGFYFTSTVRKLPSSSSYVTQQIYDNRSPLHTINNVHYAFNSNSTRFNLHEWGLEAMPKLAANVAKIIGYDAETLFAKLKANKVTNKFNTKIKKELNVGETVDETKSSFFTNAMTQTDDVALVSGRKCKGHDIGVQAMPARVSIGAQTTLAVGSNNPTVIATNNDLPLMKLINQLNENQLLALNDFAELIREPSSSSAMDMYHLRQRMLEIYKCSQMPSSVPVTNVTKPDDSNSHYQSNGQNVHRATALSDSITVDTNTSVHHLQRNPAAYRQIPVQLSNTQQLQSPQAPSLHLQRLQHTQQAQNIQQQQYIPQQSSINSVYEFNSQIPNSTTPLNYVAPPSKKYHGRGGLRR